LNKSIESKFKVANAIMADANYQLFFDYDAIGSARKNLDEIIKFSITELEKDTAILMAFEIRNLAYENMPAEMKNRFVNGINKKLSGDVALVLKPGFIIGSRSGTTHGAWYPYDAHIPMVFMGWGVKQGHTNRPTYMTDIAPTISAMLRIQMPSGSIGTPVFEITD
jgi:hypothetical protein